MIICKICGSRSHLSFTARVLEKYNVSYFKCERCGFVQTEEPYWLSEAYSSAIAAQDIGLIYRNIFFAPIVSIVIKFFYNKDGNFLDYGGGYGMFVRLMRDRGFQFYRYDTYCENLFAKEHEDNGRLQYELITSFEVFEHLTEPIIEIQEMLKKSRNIFFSTELQPTHFLNEKDWWYVMPETGQHIALYSVDSLKFIAKKNNLNFYSNGSTFHLFSEKKINPFLFKLMTNKYIVKIGNKILKSPSSLMMKDYKSLLNK